MKKIGEIKGIPVVEGNINEVTKNQIHYKEDSGSIQLSKRGNDNKLNSVTGSSSGGGGGILYLKYNGERHFMDVANKPFTNMIPIIAGVAIYNDGGSRNSIRSYYSAELYSFHTTIDGFGEVAIPKIECNYGNREFGTEYVLNTNSLENMCISMAKMLVDNSDFFEVPITFEQAILQVKEMLKDWEECSEEEFYEIFNQYR